MTDDLTQGGFGPPRKKWSVTKTLLVILISLLAFSCMACVIGAYWLSRPGKPVPPTQFIDDSTKGIVVLRVDPANQGLKQVLAYGIESAMKQNLIQRKDEIRGYMEALGSGRSAILAFSVIASYKGTGPADVRAFAVVMLRELPRYARMVASHSYKAMAEEAKGQPFADRLIVDGKNLAGLLGEKGLDVGREAGPMLENTQLSLADSCIFVGRTVDDVKAGLAALDAPEPTPQSPFLELYRRANSSATIYGALSNENDLALAALAPPDQVSAMREKITSVILIDPQQVKDLTFSVVFVSDDEATVQLAAVGANPDVARQMAAGVQAFADATAPAARKLPLHFAIVASEINGSFYSATVKVTGLRELIDSLLADAAAAKARAPEGAAPDNQRPRQ